MQLKKSDDAVHPFYRAEMEESESVGSSHGDNTSA